MRLKQAPEKYILPQKYVYKSIVVTFLNNKTHPGDPVTWYFSLGGYTGSQTVLRDLYETAQRSKDSLVCVLGGEDVVVNKGEPYAFPDLDSLLFYYKEKVLSLVKSAKNNNETLIIGLSEFANEGLMLQVLKILSDIKSQYPNLILAIGGPEFNAIHKSSSYRFCFEKGVDIINIGGHKEFVDLIGNLSKSESFERGENGLKFNSDRTIPSNVLFSGYPIQELKITKGTNGHVYPAIIPNANKVLYYINGSGCLNSCHFCSETRDRNKILGSEDIDLIAKDLQAQLDKAGTFLQGEDMIRLDFGNPNPMQHIGRFSKLLDKLDLSKVEDITLFGDFIGLHSENNYKIHCEIIDNLTQKYPKLNIVYVWGIDAVGYENDGEFIGKTIGRKVASQGYYDKAILNLFKLFRKTNEINSRGFNYYHSTNWIIHPAMGPLEYIEKNSLYRKFVDLGLNWDEFRRFILSPYKGTKIEQMHSKYTLENVKDILNTDSLPIDQVSVWSYFYKNSHLLDAHVLTKLLFDNQTQVMVFEDILGSVDNKSLYFIPHVVILLIRSLIVSYSMDGVQTQGESAVHVLTRFDDIINYLSFMKKRDLTINEKTPFDDQSIIALRSGLLDSLIQTINIIKDNIDYLGKDEKQLDIVIDRTIDSFYSAVGNLNKPTY